MIERYSITVRRHARSKSDKYPFQLFNEANGEPVGSRLLKGKGVPPLVSDLKSVLHPWECSWSRYKTQDEALTAASALQTYLDDYENPKAAKARKVKEKPAEAVLI